MNKPTMIEGACAVVLDAEGRVLLVKREDFRVWVLPGGRLEPGETPEEGAMREVEEETGYRIAIDRYVGSYTIPDGPLGPQRSHCFVGHVIGGHAIERGPETAAVGWFPPDRLPRRLVGSNRLRLQDALSGHDQPIERVMKIPAWRQWLMKGLLAARDLRNRATRRP